MPGDGLTPANVFEDGVGHFWGIMGTRPYMRARFELVDAMLHHFGSAGGRVDVVQAALDHLLDMLRLCRSDNMGVRDMIPALYIRLRREQAAYDFMKWYATTGQDPRYNWGDMDLPFLDIKDGDVFESPAGMWTDEWLDLSHSSAVVLVKVRVLLDLQAVQNALCALGGNVPQEVIRRRLVGTIVESRPEVLRGDMEEIARFLEKIKGQVKQLCVAIDKYNPHFWPLMFNNPAASIAVKPVAYSPGTQEEACLMLSYNFAAWVETTGAIDMIKTLSQVV